MTNLPSSPPAASPTSSVRPLLSRRPSAPLNEVLIDLNLVENETDQESVPLWKPVLARVADPSWLVSFAVHLGLLLLLAWWILPVIKRPAVAIISDPSVAPQMVDFNLQPFELDDADLDLDSQLDVEDSNELTLSDEIQLNQSLDLELNSQDLDVDLTEHNALLAAATGDDASGLNQTGQQHAVQAIQQKVASAGGKQGEVQFSLVWKTISDLDLHVVTPAGERVSYQHKRSQCRGVLDVDRNAKEFDDSPVENVRWLEGKPESGRYTVLVHLYRLRGRRTDEIEFELMAKLGENVELIEDAVSIRDRLHVVRFVYFDPSISAASRPRRLEQLKRLQEQEEETASSALDKIQPGMPQEIAMLSQIVRSYPHTDAAIRALLRLSGKGGK